MVHKNTDVAWADFEFDTCSKKTNEPQKCHVRFPIICRMCVCFRSTKMIY